ncbi:hydroxymethylglutaryl-CoA reductase [Owenweeksia hongkongensis]|uniref:hydroxymethylglutaryl-CoA reductase n=1 Tax=Owenweeksia hongkongensis TaxID=253245 RepID=UPI003A8E2FFB
MADNLNRVARVVRDLENEYTAFQFLKRMSPLTASQLAELDSSTYSKGIDKEAQLSRLNFLKERGAELENIRLNESKISPENYKGSIENYIGMAQIPLGLAGPLLVNGAHAHGDFYIPLATTEGALVASYNRGMKACRLSGGITSLCIAEGIQRSPSFKFKNIGEAGLFVKWTYDHLEDFNRITKESSNFAKLNDIKTNLEGNTVILTFEYSTGDASGQNMVTFCTDNICQYILKEFSIKPQQWYIESNFSGDKKATAVSFSTYRGKKVTAEALLPKKVVEEVLKSTPKAVADYWQTSTLGVVQSGAIGAQGHIANGLTALFIACGQDVACVAESSVGITRMEVSAEGDLYVSLMLPSIMAGTIGGGTGLGTQKECLQMMDCYGAGKAKKFAEICGALALAGEVSIAAAMSSGHFSIAHQNLGRKK